MYIYCKVFVTEGGSFIVGIWDLGREEVRLGKFFGKRDVGVRFIG